MESHNQIWSTLRADNSKNKGLIRLRIKPDSCCGFYLAVEKPGDFRALVIEVDASALPKGIMYPHSKGFEVISGIISPGANGIVRLLLKEVDSRFADIFTVLVKSIVDRAAIQSCQKDVITEFISHLARWQTFMHKYPPEGLGIHAQQGLYAELWFLLNKLINGLDSARAIQSWVGPSGANQDFQFISCAIEVKSTSSNPHEIVTISNVRQLDGTGIDTLFLFHLALDIRQGGVQSLPELVSELRESLGESEWMVRQMFEDRLLDAGYLDVHESSYELNKYALRHYHFFKIEDGFPRIIEEGLTLGVGNVQYSISIAACMPFRIDEEHVLQTVTGENDVR